MKTKNFLLVLGVWASAFSIGTLDTQWNIIQAVLICGSSLVLFILTWLNMDYSDVKIEEPATQVPTYSNAKKLGE